MVELELLAPARNADIGIAAIDCGADAVYIAGPDFGARKAAGNPVSEIRRLCDYAHLFGARVFVTFNILVRDAEWESLHAQMLEAQEAGADAFIIREPRIAQFPDITVPLHASTQCAIRTPADAARLEALGCSRLILERQLSLGDIRAIRAAVSSDLEFFVHGALCVGYSGECLLSERLDGRSGDRGDCAQCCRSLYNLVDGQGRVISRNKALLSLKDFNLISRLSDLVDAGVVSFKIEGRLKNASYVKNVVREYSLALDSLVASRSSELRRASFGKVSGGFEPDTRKTFNRGYTELWLDGTRGRWSSMDAPKSMGEYIGAVSRVVLSGSGLKVSVDTEPGVRLGNGDGLSFVGRTEIVGFRADSAEADTFRCKRIDGLAEGVRLFRNVDLSFERELERNMPVRELRVEVRASFAPDGTARVEACCENGAKAVSEQDFSSMPTASDTARMRSMVYEGLSRRAGHFSFTCTGVEGERLPLIPSSAINSIRRGLAGELAAATPSSRRIRPSVGKAVEAGEAPSREPGVLLKTRYCIRHELGICLKDCDARERGPLFLENNGRCLPLRFDCAKCEMSVLDIKK